MARQRRVPVRTCIGCRATRPKRELVRMVRTPDLVVRLDPTGKESGRGVYVCPRQTCVEAALRKGRLLQALGKGLEEAERRRLRLERHEEERLLAWARQREGR